MEQKLIPITDKIGWENALNDIPHGPAHLWAYNKAMMQTTKYPTYLYSAQTTDFKAICPVAIREKFNKQDLLTPYGFGGFITIGTNADFSIACKDFFANQGFVCGYLALHPLFNNPHNFSLEAAHHHVYIIDLKSSLEALMHDLSKVHRYELKKWQEKQFIIHFDKGTLLPRLASLYRDTLGRVGASSVYHFSTETLSLLANSNALILGVEENGHVEAISVFLYSTHIAEYFLNASTPMGRVHARGLIWEGIKALKALNIPLLNLGGGVKPSDSLDDFKRRFGGKKTPYYVMKEIYDPKTFNYLCQRAKTASAFFPPYY